MPSYAIAEHHDPVRHPLALIDAATPVDALAEYVVGEGFADPRETAREADPEWFYALEAGDAVGCAFTNTELVAFPAELVRGGGAMTHRYIARGGRVYVRHADGREEEAATALSANGRDLERHARALDVARYQQSILRLRVPSEADRVRVALHDDPTVDNETYGRLVEEAAEADERHSWKAEDPDRDIDELDTEVLKEIADDVARPIEERRAAWRAFNRRLAPKPEIPVAEEEELELRFSADRGELISDPATRALADRGEAFAGDEPDTAPCEVCGEAVRAGLRYMAGPFAGRMFCESHDPLRGGPRSGYPELEGGAVNDTPSTPQEKVAARIAELVAADAPAGGIFRDEPIGFVSKPLIAGDTKTPTRFVVYAPGIADYRMPGPHAPRFEITVTPLS